MSNQEAFVEDLRGEMVREGDQIAYAATDGRSSGLRVGHVIEIIPAHQKPIYRGSDYMTDVPTKLRVDVGKSSGYGVPGKPTLIDATFKRFVKIRP